ncbi:MAG: methyltransferase domain-containing protein [Burkholderiaceae bacterium]
MADFNTRDPARADFWDERYRAGVMPWDAGGVPPALDRCLPLALPARVLIPGCGRAYEAGWLLAQGFEVSAIDISAVALEQARAVLQEPAAACVRQADFFADDFGASFDWIYERAFLCALPPRLWTDWAARCAALLRPGGRLAGYFVLADELPAPRRGPPFVTTRDELAALLAADFDLLEEVEVGETLPIFRGERWLVWVKR